MARTARQRRRGPSARVLSPPTPPWWQCVARLRSLRGAPALPPAPSFHFEKEAHCMMASLVVHVVFGEAFLTVLERKALCQQVAVLRALCPIPFFGATALERAVVARAALVTTTRGLILQRRRQVGAFQDQAACLLGSIVS